jgi:hypothetical protein
MEERGKGPEPMKAIEEISDNAIADERARSSRTVRST